MSDKEIADLWMKGCSTPEIAHALELPEKEVMHAIVRAANDAHRQGDLWPQSAKPLTD